ncbi:MAG: SRPBCC family protein [Pseudomonadota bacterium]
MSPLLALALLAAPLRALDLGRLDPATIAALSAEGPVVAMALDASGRPGLATAAVVVEAPPQAVWDAMAGFAAYPGWVPQVQAAEVRAADETGATVAFELAFDFFLTIHVDYTLRYRRVGPWRMEWSQVEGDFARNEGFWEIQPYGGGSLFYYGVLADYSSMRLLRGVLEAQPALELGLGSSSAAVVAQAVKGRVEGGASGRAPPGPDRPGDCRRPR